jgi:glutamyl-tRNA reductase
VHSERPLLHAAVVGISWKSAPAEIRDECLLPPERAEALLSALRAQGVREGAVLSTCNRVEIWTASESPQFASEACLAQWEEICHPRAGWIDRLYIHHHEAAVEHIFRVAASVDSLVLGETQIPSQVRLAWESAHAQGHAGFFLTRLSQAALAASKRVRAGTKLGEGALSVSSAAVDLARKIAGDLSKLSVGIVGAGEMAELALTGFVRAGSTKFVYANRTVANARRLQAIHPGRVEDLSALEAILAESDVVVSATGATGFVVTPELARSAMRGRRRPLFLLDIAAPRDVDPEVSRVPGVFLYGIDDLEQVVDRNRHKRGEEAVLAESILAVELDKFRQWWRGLSVVPILSDLRDHVHAVAHAEVSRFLPRVRRAHGEEELHEILDDFAQALANKFLHGPTVGARKAAVLGHEPEVAAVLRELFLSGDTE